MGENIGFFKGLQGKLLLWFLGISLIPLIVVSFISYQNSSKSLEKLTFDELEAVNSLERDSIERFFEEAFTELSVVAMTDVTRNSFRKLKAYHDAGGATPTGPFDVSAERYKAIYDEMNPFFSSFLEKTKFYDIFFICADHGHVMYTGTGESDLGTNLATGPYRNSSLAKLWSSIVKSGKPQMADYAHYEPSGSNAIFIGEPQKDERGNVYAVLALQIDDKAVDRLVQSTAGMGDTGETYLVGDDKIMRSNARLSRESTLIKQLVDTDAVNFFKKGTADQKFTGFTIDYLGEKVLSVAMPVGLNKKFGANFDWLIVTEKNVEEALAPVRALRNWVMLIFLLSAGIVVVIALMVAARIVEPIKEVAAATTRVAEGDLTVSVAARSEDEIGMMAKAFNSTVASLRKIVSEVLASSDRVSSSAQQLSSAAEEMNATTEEVSSTVQQIAQGTETQAQRVDDTQKVMEQMAVSLAQVSKSAQDVAGQAGKSSEAAKASGNFTKETIEKIVDVSGGLVGIAEQMKKLGERSEQVGDIVDVITNIADQTNLLALNAAIEAARAGEYGRGFAVVAEEVRKLAEASAKSADEIGKLIKDVQKETEQAVTGIEASSRDALIVREMSQNVGKNLELIIKNADQLAIMIEEVAAVSQDQAAGTSRVSKSVSEIASVAEETASATEEASASTEEMTASMEEMAASAQELADMGIAMKNLVGKFKLGEGVAADVQRSSSDIEREKKYAILKEKTAGIKQKIAQKLKK